MGLRARMMLLVALTLLPAMGLLVYQASELRRAAIADARKSAQLLARETASGQERLIHSAHQLLVAVSQLPQVYSRDIEGCDALFDRLLTQYPLYSNLALASPDGQVVASAVKLSAPVNVSSFPFFRRAIKKRDFVNGDYLLDPVTGRPSLHFARPVLDAESKPHAVVFLAYDLGWVQRLIRAMDAPPDTTAVVVDEEGTILARYPNSPQWIGKTMPNVPLVKRLLAGKPGAFEAEGLDGVRRFYSFTRLFGTPGNPVYLAVGISKKTALAEADRVLARSVTGLLVAGALALAAAWFVSDWIVLRRVKILLGTVNRLAAGERYPLTGLQGGDEIATLASAFDAMSVALRKREGELLDANRRAIEAKAGERFQALVLHASNAILTIDPQSRVTLWNPAAEKLFGYTAAEAIGRDVAALIIPREYRDRHYEGMRRLLTTGDGPLVDSNVQISAQRADGSVFPIELSLFQSETGESPRFTAIVRDITDRKRRDEALKRAHDELESRVRERTAELAKSLEELKHTAQQLAESNRELEQFAYVASHDLQEPLRKIIAFSDRLAEKPLERVSDTEIDYFLRMRNAGFRMKVLIEDLLNFSRVAHAPTLDEPVRLGDIVHDALKDLEIRIVQTGAHVSVAELPVVRANPLHMRQLFLNLVGNALKFAKPGQPPRVRIESFPREDGRFELTVSDNGIGFDEKYLDRIFKPFQRLHGKEEFEGTGMGLAICQKIVRRYGGTVTGSSRPGEGAVFTVILPVRTPLPVDFFDEKKARIC